MSPFSISKKVFVVFMIFISKNELKEFEQIYSNSDLLNDHCVRNVKFCFMKLCVSVVCRSYDPLNSFFGHFFACANSKIFSSKTIVQNSMKVDIFVPLDVPNNGTVWIFIS